MCNQLTTSRWLYKQLLPNTVLLYAYFSSRWKLLGTILNFQQLYCQFLLFLVLSLQTHHHIYNIYDVWTYQYELVTVFITDNSLSLLLVSCFIQAILCNSDIQFCKMVVDLIQYNCQQLDWVIIIRVSYIMWNQECLYTTIYISNGTSKIQAYS